MDGLYPLNFFVGRNNTGKSALAAAIGELCKERNMSGILRPDGSIGAFVSTPINDQLISTFEDNETLNRQIPRGMLRSTKGNILEIKFRDSANAAYSDRVLQPGHNYATHFEELARISFKQLFPLRHKVFLRIAAARNIVPEDLREKRFVESGEGATAWIARFVNSADLDSELVEKTLLNSLNEICLPDAEFLRVFPRLRSGSDSQWEIFLQERGKGSVALSESGSGLKTILLVLVFVHLFPSAQGKPLSELVLAIEEPENNLHPALQRKLFSFIRKKATNEGFTVIVTTHSPVILDMFADDDNARIHHVTQENGKIRVKNVTEYMHKIAILDDLEIRASDVLQANGVIWVEGPTDRLYMNKWIDLWSDGQLREGTHYQCVFYGGRLLSHLTAEPDNEELVKIVLVNRNAIVLIDSDRDNDSGAINASKQRIATEVQRNGGLAWVTAGREVENYIPMSVLSAIVGNPIAPKLEQYEDAELYLERNSEAQSKRFKRDKVGFTEEVVQRLTDKGSFVDALDLSEKIEAVCSRIRQWNGMVT